MKKATGNRKGQEAFKVLQAWREYGVPEFITEYETYSLTGGIIGKPSSTKGIRLIDAAVRYVNRGGSFKDWSKLKEGK